MSQMQPRQVAHTSMAGRQSNDASIAHYKYEEHSFQFEQPLITYDYYSNRGEMKPHSVPSAEMKGR